MQMTETAKLIKSKRSSLNMTQQFVSQKLGYHVQFVSDWERARSQPPKKTLKKLCSLLKLNTSDLKAALVDDYFTELKKYL